MSIRIAIDAMGGDYAPIEIIKGAVIGAREYNVALQLVGPIDIIEKELKKHDTSGLDIKLTQADEVIEMDESPGTAIRRKRNSSFTRSRPPSRRAGEERRLYFSTETSQNTRG